MTDFEVLPVGTTQRLKDLEAELAIFRKAEKEAEEDVNSWTAREIKNSIKLTESL